MQDVYKMHPAAIEKDKNDAALACKTCCSLCVSKSDTFVFDRDLICSHNEAWQDVHTESGLQLYYPQIAKNQKTALFFIFLL